MQNCFGDSDPAMEEAMYETFLLRQFAGMSLERLPDETTILNFRRLLEKHELAADILAVINSYLGDRGLSLRQGTIVDATLINAPSLTKNKDGKRDPEMHQTKKGQQYYFGIKAHIGVDAESRLVHRVVCTAANVQIIPRSTNCCMARKTRSVPTRVTPASRNALSMKTGRSPGRSRPAAVLTRSWARATCYTKPSIRSKRPRRRLGPMSITRSE